MPRRSPLESPALCAEIIEFLEQGASFDDLKELRGVSRYAVIRRRKQDPEFDADVAEALKKGRPRRHAETFRSRCMPDKAPTPTLPAPVRAPVQVVPGLPPALVGDADAAPGVSVAWCLEEARRTWDDKDADPRLRALALRLLWGYKMEPVIRAAERAAITAEREAGSGEEAPGVLVVQLPPNARVPSS
jgi:hypothetical protein